ncbi:MAG: hypothetical protein H7839_23715, partial [Magnetococcus sp. YQC-5]
FSDSGIVSNTGPGWPERRSVRYICPFSVSDAVAIYFRLTHQPPFRPPRAGVAHNTTVREALGAGRHQNQNIPTDHTLDTNAKTSRREPLVPTPSCLGVHPAMGSAMAKIRMRRKTPLHSLVREKPCQREKLLFLHIHHCHDIQPWQWTRRCPSARGPV